MWIADVLHLPPSLWGAYRNLLIKHDKLTLCEEGQSGRAVYGGATEDETLDHFVRRFTNSASRLCYLVLNPRNETTVVTNDIRVSFACGEVHVLDLVGGTGAAAAGLLTTLCHFRERGVLPKLPLTVIIHAADISETALQLYADLIEELRPTLLASGISVHVSPKEWDATDVAQTSQLCDEWLLRAGNKEVFVIVSNISGAGKKHFDAFQRPFQHITERIANRDSTFLWVEHNGNSAKEFLGRAIKAILSGKWFKKRHADLNPINYDFFHEIQKQRKLISSGFIVLDYQRRDA